ncbi:glycosyltransferase family 2 protein [Alkaliphilus hydrothermalis]|uniref:GTP:adenosylcobinamide-phosphate guanylyltransferase n=1 Tax=Alkaliphilus hydrothermalis TaxID=1482730 RepID=A0ABS2NLD3_9FIRM|nr:glycosyltransferase family 2 protein [Alkaliphilus hydrothermalis]MBM7613701.1 GTP:adenosylcobinamide-phosphate guanylyltransferase [Alkaliphilus hydrothermalis]
MKISAIIPAFNEEERIENVIKPLLELSKISRIIVIDDGSTDNTPHVVRRYPVELICLPQNRGKAEAVKEGLSHCREDVVLMLDADLIGLTCQHIDDLLVPVMDSSIQMTIGIFEGGRFITDMAQRVAPNLSGQRAFKGELIQEILNLDTAGYSIEMALSKMIKERNILTKKITLKNASHVTKEEKIGIYKGALWRMKMYGDIIKHWLN